MAQTLTQPEYDPYPVESGGVDPLYGQDVEKLTEHDRRQYDEYQARENTEQERYAQEEVRKSELEHASLTTSQSNAVAEDLRKIKKPSFVLYYAFISLMALTDVIDIADFTGVGIIITRIIQVIVLIVSTLVAWHSGQRIKAMSDVHTTIAARTDQLVHRLAIYRQRYAKALRIGRRLGMLKRGSVGARAVARIGKVTKFTRAPIIKNTIGNLLEFSPLGVIPWQTVFAIWTYLDHKSAYKHAMTAIPEYQRAQAEEASEFSESQVALYEDLMEEEESEEDGETPETA